MNHWSKLKDDIRTAGGAWPPPGCKEVERAVSRRPPSKDWETLVRMELELRRLRTAITNGRSRDRQNLREQYFELKARFDAYHSTEADT